MPKEGTSQTKDQRRQSHLAKLSPRSIIKKRSQAEADLDLQAHFTDFSTNGRVMSATHPFLRPNKRRRRRQLTLTRGWQFRLMVARYLTTMVLSMIFLLASGQQSMNAHVLESNAAAAIDTDNQTPPSISAEGRRASSSTSSSSGRGWDLVTPGFSMSRNSLISGDTLLQRQLREKAKQDSLESIKMHILMRLNLKKLPNITKPISVPQQILENFYKNYNSSLLSSKWGQNSKPNPHLNVDAETSPPRSESHIPDEMGLVQAKHAEQYPNLNKRASSSKGITPSSSEMVGDDPNIFKDNTDTDQMDQRNVDRDFTINDEGMENESILSHINSVYIFPEQSHVRHNRRTDVLRFKFDTGYSDISYITLHLYLRGLDWIRTYQPMILDQLSDYKNQEIIVDLHRGIRRSNSTNYTHKAKIFEFRHKIPSGLGQWINVDLKPLIGTVIDPSQTQEIFIKGVEPWMKPLVVTTDSAAKNPLTVHIEIGSRKKHRRKRSVYLDCTESDHDMRCCRYPLKVNFTSFGWHFVVAPTSFDAYFCSGDCRVGYLEQYPHTHLAALTTSATPCCSPTKMSSLSLLYFDDSQQLVLSVIPNMSVEGCSCS